MLLRREVGKGVRRVVADGDEGDAGGLDPFVVGLQLHQLRLAERSPLGRTIEDQRNLPVLQEVVQGSLLALLVLQGKGGCLGPDRQGLGLRGGTGEPPTGRAGAVAGGSEGVVEFVPQPTRTANRPAAPSERDEESGRECKKRIESSKASFGRPGGGRKPYSIRVRCCRRPRGYSETGT